MDLYSYLQQFLPKLVTETGQYFWYYKDKNKFTLTTLVVGLSIVFSAYMASCQGVAISMNEEYLEICDIVERVLY